MWIKAHISKQFNAFTGKPLPPAVEILLKNKSWYLIGHNYCCYNLWLFRFYILSYIVTHCHHEETVVYCVKHIFSVRRPVVVSHLSVSTFVWSPACWKMTVFSVCLNGIQRSWDHVSIWNEFRGMPISQNTMHADNDCLAGRGLWRCCRGGGHTWTASAHHTSTTFRYGLGPEWGCWCLYGADSWEGAAELETTTEIKNDAEKCWNVLGFAVRLLKWCRNPGREHGETTPHHRLLWHSSSNRHIRNENCIIL